MGILWFSAGAHCTRKVSAYLIGIQVLICLLSIKNTDKVQYGIIKDCFKYKEKRLTINKLIGTNDPRQECANKEALKEEEH